MVRFRISSYTSAGNFSLHIGQVDLINSTVPATINIIQATTSLSPANLTCSTTNTGQIRCQRLPNLSPIVLTTAPSTFQPKALDIYSTILRSGGSLAVQKPCSSSSTFLMLNPSVTTLGPLTAGTWTNDKVWRTSCSTAWDCGGADPALNMWTSCKAPAWNFKKSFPTSGGNQYSNFILSVTHRFPLMMATSIRGSNTPDLSLADPLEAAGLEVVLTGQDVVIKEGGILTNVMQGGIDQSGNCDTGCTFSGTVTSVDIADVEIV
ncbi:hypothetical protein BGZ60DRAFT_231258 [Tricladium varicosporioides]|nr:hypothetical protein BGZ60DRAFT_231258 [Hymenoscyphus varicosporioides]